MNACRCDRFRRQRALDGCPVFVVEWRSTLAVFIPYYCKISFGARTQGVDPGFI
jgi:hypothetical protein